jgi:hypothetical protein
MRGMISHHCQVRAWLPLWVLALSALALAAVLVGCGQPAAESPSPANRQPDAATTRQPSPTDGISRVAADQIAPLGDPLPPLDGGRLRLSIPRDWTLPPRDKEFLVRMQAQLNDPYPSILLTGDDSIGMDELTARNVRDLADRTQVALDEELTAQGARLTGAVEPLRIGDRYWIEYGRTARSGQKLLERLFLVTVAGGRKYTLELRTYVGSQLKHRGALLAVASSLTLAESGASAAPHAAEPPAAEPPSVAPDTSGRP